MHFADEIVSPYAHRTLSIDESEGNVITLLDRMESQGELAAGGLEPVVLSCGPLPMMKAVACGRPRGASNASSAWSSAMGMRIRHMRDLRGRYGRRAQQGVL